MILFVKERHSSVRAQFCCVIQFIQIFFPIKKAGRLIGVSSHFERRVKCLLLQLPRCGCTTTDDFLLKAGVRREEEEHWSPRELLLSGEQGLPDQLRGGDLEQRRAAACKIENIPSAATLSFSWS